MAEVTKLVIAGLPETQDSALDSFDEVVAKHREIMTEHPDSGFVILTYRRPNTGRLTSLINYHLNEPMDAYALPDFLAERMKNLRDGT